MLNSHPRIFIANEAKVFVRFLPRALRKSLQLDIKAAQDVINGLENNELYYLKPLPAASDVLNGHDNIAPCIFIKRMFEDLAAREGKSRWGEKTAVAYRQLPIIRECFPDAIYIGLDRDPYERAASYVKVNPKWGALGAIVHWLDFRRAIYSQGTEFNCLLVSYRNLVSDPEATLSGICAHIGESYEDDMLEFHTSDRAKFLASDATFNGASKPLYSKSGASSRMHNGVTGHLINRLIKADPLRDPVKNRVSVLLPVVKLWVYAQAIMWEILHRSK